ncbi:Inositol 2-dehydrogenase/D-chiro-inositol 3-dehydrogenase [Novipirellula aureliae]|uniref:Inositol 2-dehydrogenase/D-chiro-inositol 3-dehydrogenase n=1 Tax=Novipirellula aureliae TaxID=2527966 RepID=A0A5C6DN87_9BACT|nr:Gfo/Idh/MocA family oxidoreductase [Novipirellula aureliae]TWU37634.1 Inositol 2-dehydrogenase/D-chiro-inositol 3-dehydrogenase [Novipirellula aureliae]
MKLRIGLIGLGDSWQTRHRPAIRMLQDRFDVRAVYSPVAKLAENAAAEFQADPVDGYRAMVARCDIDAVMVLQNSWLGWLPMLAACEAGKAIYWAGDLDFDPAEAQPIREAIDRSGIAFMTELPKRFAPATLRLKELIATRLGPPQLVFCHRRVQHESNHSKPKCVADNPLHQELLELIDLCRYVVGREPATVVATGVSQTVPADYESMSLRFDAHESQPAVTAQISCGSYIRPTWHEAIGFRPPSAMQICCERGVAFLDLPTSLVWFDDAGRHLESLETELSVGQQLLTQFYRAVTSLVRNMSDLDDVCRSAAILAAARESSRDGRRIELA